MVKQVRRKISRKVSKKKRGRRTTNSNESLLSNYYISDPAQGTGIMSRRLHASGERKDMWGRLGIEHCRLRIGNIVLNILTKQDAKHPTTLHVSCECITFSLFLMCAHVQSCPTLCHPTDCSPLGFSVHRTFQARILEWVAISYSRRSPQPRDWTNASCTAGRFFTTEPPGNPSLPH